MNVLSKTVFLSILLLCSCTSEMPLKQAAEIPEPGIYHLEIVPDKEVYHSKELMELRVDISSNASSRVQVAIYGLEEGGTPRMYEVVPMNLTEGNNMVMVGYTLPNCNTCSGLPAGTYNIYAEVYYDNSLINSTRKSIELRQ